MTGTATGAGRRVVVVGAGGNVGSHLVPLLARLPGLSSVTLVDPDRYRRRNLRSQAIERADVGRRKAGVQAERLRRIDPALEVRALAQPVEQTPLGELRDAVVLTALDSRRSRQFVSWATTRLGSPWIDAGVSGAELLVRIDVYLPGAGGPCMECSWSDEDYRLLEQSYPCSSAEVAAPTDAPAALGALAASLQALEARRLMAEAPAAATEGRRVVLDARHHRLLRTRLTANPDCRLGGHRPWRIESVVGAGVTLEELAAAPGSGAGPEWLRVEAHLIARRAVCPACGDERPGPWLVAAYAPALPACARCGEEQRTAGFDLAERLDLEELGARAASLSLAALGARAGDVLALESRRGGARRWLIGSDRR